MWATAWSSTLRTNFQRPLRVHWHGVRLPIEMDGVPGISQPEVKPGETFIYDFIVPDAGLFWYHPHVDSAWQVSSGLYGALIVEDPAETVGIGDELVLVERHRCDRSGIPDSCGGRQHRDGVWARRQHCSSQRPKGRHTRGALWGPAALAHRKCCEVALLHVHSRRRKHNDQNWRRRRLAGIPGRAR